MLNPLPKTMAFYGNPSQKKVNAAFDCLRQADAIVKESIANGTHSTTAHNVCGACGEWCPPPGGHYYIGFDGKGICATCADKIGVGPKSDRKARGAQ